MCVQTCVKVTDMSSLFSYNFNPQHILSQDLSCTASKHTLCITTKSITSTTLYIVTAADTTQSSFWHFTWWFSTQCGGSTKDRRRQKPCYFNMRSDYVRVLSITGCCNTLNLQGLLCECDGCKQHGIRLTNISPPWAFQDRINPAEKLPVFVWPRLTESYRQAAMFVFPEQNKEKDREKSERRREKDNK